MLSSFSNDDGAISLTNLAELLETVGNETEAERPSEWAQINRQFTRITFFIESAGKSLSDYL